MTRKNTIYALLGLVLVAGLTTGCREEEQDRVLLLEPGVYQGKPDSPLSEATEEELRQRARNQGAL
ncbi:MAG: hypothetical protein P8X75_10370 [Limibacillus sp.]|jgi:hypothetical protein